MAKRKPLGRGLQALIPARPETATGEQVVLCDIGRIKPNRGQPRQSFDEERLRELTDSIKQRGLIHPLIVRTTDDGYQIVAGERRWRAARLAGLRRVPVIVKELTDGEVLELALVENLQREDLNPLEEAEAYRQLVEEHGLSQSQIAERVGRNRSSVTNTLRLLKLPSQVKQYLAEGQLSMGHAKALLAAKSATEQERLARLVVKQGLSVRQCERLASGDSSPQKPRSRRRAHDGYTANERQLLDQLQRRLGTKVDLRQGRKGGKLIITYYSLEQLDHICQQLSGSR